MVNKIVDKLMVWGIVFHKHKDLGSLNEGLPIKVVKQKFRRKQYFFLEKDCNFNSGIIRTSVFHI